MVHLLPRLPPLSALAPHLSQRLKAPLSAPLAALARNRAAQRAWPGQVAGVVLDHLLRSGSFDGALIGQPGFTHRRSSDGRICLRNQTRLCGARITALEVELQFAQTGAAEFARQTLTTLIAARLGLAPPWRDTADGVQQDLRLAPGVTLRLMASDGPVDPLFIGGALPGLTLRLTLLHAA